jgi:circadian clock protein KaiC
MEDDKLLVHLYQSPVEIQPDIHTDRVKRAVDQVGARRVLIDSLRDLEIATPDKVRYRDYVYSLVEVLKRQGITTLITNEIAQLFGNFQLSDHGISFIADNVILLRYVELEGRVSRALNVLKMRGSRHNKTIWEYIIDEHGVTVTEPVQALTGVLTGNPILNDPAAMIEMSPRARYVLSVLRVIGPASLEMLESHTGLQHDKLNEELEYLKQQELVMAVAGDEAVVYKVSS